MQQKQQSPWFQKEIKLSSYGRGCHLIHQELIKQLPEIKNFSIGMCNIFLKHTSASLTLNENYDPDVQVDLESSLNRIVPEDNKLYKHTMEGSDDMPAHVKSTLCGVSLNIPITDGKLNVGTWQGIYLNEHRNGKQSRTVVVTINGQPK